jgi:hypothetical protein
MKKRRLLPLGIKDPIKTELPALVALEAIGKPWFSETHLSDLLAIALVSQILAVKGSYIHIVAGELIAALQAPELNIEEIRPLVIDISAWLQVQDNGRVDTAIATLLKQQPK